MVNKIFRYILFILCLTSVIHAQDGLPIRTDIQFEIQADSLNRLNSGQEITLLLNGSGDINLNSLFIRIDQIDTRWTVLSSEINGQSLWLISSVSNKGRDDVLAWKDGDNTLSISPTPAQITSQLKIVAQLNFLKPLQLKDIPAAEVTMHANISGDIFRCTPVAGRQVLNLKKIN